MAKIPEGIVEGKLHWVGGFDFCLEQKINYTYYEANGSVPEPRNFTGQYCRLALSSNVCYSSDIFFILQLFQLISYYSFLLLIPVLRYKRFLWLTLNKALIVF